jgi:tetratricopeptide (TPR) repeat protein
MKFSIKSSKIVLQTPKVKLWMITIIFLVTFSIAVSDVSEEFTDYKQKELEPYKDKLTEISKAHSNDPLLNEYFTRIVLIDEVATHLMSKFQLIKTSSLDNLLEDIVAIPQNPVTKSQSVHGISALEILNEYQQRFSVQLPIPELSEQEIKTLRDYYNSSAKAAGTYIANRGQITIAIDDRYASDILELCMVIPFLHIPDNAWTQDQIKALPAWMKSPTNLRLMEDFSLRVKRPFTAYNFALFQQQSIKADGEKLDYLAYLNLTAKRTLNDRDYYVAIHCLKIAIQMAQEQTEQETAISPHFKLAEILSDTGHSSLAADQLKQILDTYPKSSQYSKAAMLRIKYLYESGLYNEILEEVSVYQADERCRTYLPQLLYISWVTHRRQGLSSEADELQKTFLERFPEHPLGADLYFASAMTALAASDYEETERLLEIIEYRYPKSKISQKAKQIQDRIAKSRKEVADKTKPR